MPWDRGRRRICGLEGDEERDSLLLCNANRLPRGYYFGDTCPTFFFFFFGLMDSFIVGQSVGGVQGSRNRSLKHFQRHGTHSVMQEGNCYGLIRNHTVHIFTILNPVSMNSPCNACNLLYS